MGLLKAKNEQVTIKFKAPADLGARLKKVEDAAAKASAQVDLDDVLSEALRKALVQAEKELFKKVVGGDAALNQLAAQAPG